MLLSFIFSAVQSFRKKNFQGKELPTNEKALNLGTGQWIVCGGCVWDSLPALWHWSSCWGRCLGLLVWLWPASKRWQHTSSSPAQLQHQARTGVTTAKKSDHQTEIVKKLKKHTSSCFGVSQRPFRTGVQTFVVHNQSTGRGVSGGGHVACESLACILGHGVWLGLHQAAPDSWGESQTEESSVDKPDSYM